MFYSWNILLARDNSSATPEKSILKLEKGTIVRLEVIFPAGCQGLVFCHVNRALHQVYPKNPDYQYAGNGETILASDEYSISEEPFQLEFFGWNTDEIYDHTVTVRIQIVPRWEITRLALAEMLRFMNMSKP